MALPSGGTSFSEKVVKEIGRLKSKHGYRGSWDHDGPGPFHKAFMNARREEDGTFSLSIGAAYVGNQPEFDLAKKIGAPVGYACCNIERAWSSKERFAIPLRDIQAVYGALGQEFDGKGFLAKLTVPIMDDHIKDYMNSFTSPVSIFEDGKISVSLQFTSWRTVAPYDAKKHPARDHGFRIENDQLTGPARD
jgi:hypothetical protein